MSINIIDSLTVGDVPRVIAVIAGKMDQFLTLAEEAKNAGAEILEFRADFCYGQRPDDIRALLRKVKAVSELPILLTVRQFPEGGYFAGTEAERLSLFKYLLPDVHAVDVEIYAKEIRDQVVASFHAANKLVVLSYHNFKHTPPLTKLNEVVEDAVSFHADMVKIAVTARSEGDVKLLSNFTADFNRDIFITSISMGETGTVSRVLNPFLGSCFTYGYVGHAPTTPGQIQIGSLRKLIDEFAGQKVFGSSDVEGLIHSAFQSNDSAKDSDLVCV